MGDLFKENWFKVLLIIVALSIAVTYALSQYIRMKEHNLDVVSAIRLCIDDRFSKEGMDDCADYAKKQYIPLYPSKEQ